MTVSMKRDWESTRLKLLTISVHWINLHQNADFFIQKSSWTAQIWWRNRAIMCLTLIFSIPCQPSCSAVWWGWNFLDFGSTKQQKNTSYISITYALSNAAENWRSSPLGIKFPDFYCSSAKKSGNEEQLLKEIEWCSEISVIAWY